MQGFCPFLSKSTTDVVPCNENCNLCRHTYTFEGGIPTEHYECALKLIADSLNPKKED